MNIHVRNYLFFALSVSLFAAENVDDCQQRELKRRKKEGTNQVASKLKGREEKTIS